MRRRGFWLVACFVMSAGVVMAQDAAPAASGAVALGAAAPVVVKGSLTGHVFLSDTNGPARFARVMLKPVPDAASAAAASKGGDDLLSSMTEMFGGKDDKDKDDAKPAKADDKTPKKPVDPDEKAGTAALAKMMSSMNDLNLSATVGADGMYTIKGVKPGTYYVHAALSGYVDPMKAIPYEDLTNPDAVVQQRVSAQVTTVTIHGEDAVHQDLKLERGAAISGHVSYDDGSPAVGWDVAVIRVQKATDGTVSSDPDAGLPDLMDSIAKVSHATDDRGEYRIASLAGGDYIVKATLTSANASGGGLIGGGQLKLTVLSGNVVHREDATPVTVTTGEERGDVNLVMPLNKMHSVSGRVEAKTDAHPINSGNVMLTDDSAGAGGIFQMQQAAIQDDGTFRFDYISNGHYTLKVKKAEITEKTGKTTKFFGIEVPDDTALRAFGNGEQKVDVSDADVSGVVFTLKDVPVEAKKKKGED